MVFICLSPWALLLYAASPPELQKSFFAAGIASSQLMSTYALVKDLTIGGHAIFSGIRAMCKFIFFAFRELTAVRSNSVQHCRSQKLPYKRVE